MTGTMTHVAGSPWRVLVDTARHSGMNKKMSACPGWLRVQSHAGYPILGDCCRGAQLQVFAHPGHGIAGGRVPMGLDMQDTHQSRILKDWYFATIEPGQNAGLIRVIVFWS